MANNREDGEFRKRVQRLEGLIEEVERFPEPAARDRTRAIVQGILEMHGAALENIFEHMAAAGKPGLAIIDALGQDDLVGSLLLLYGLHPLDLETRVQQALDRVRPSLRSQGGTVELLGIAEGVVQLRLLGSCDSGHSALTLKQTIEEAIYDKAPDVAAIEVEDAMEQRPGRVSLPLLRG